MHGFIYSLASLAALIPALSAFQLTARLESLRAEPQLKLFEAPSVKVEEHLAPARGNWLVSAPYHKTGIVYSRGLVQSLGHLSVLELLPLIHVNASFETQLPTNARGRFWEEALEPSSHRLDIVEAPASYWPRHDAKLLHWYRDPVDLILSAYKYHRSLGPDSGDESWVSDSSPSACAYCDAESYQVLFKDCDYQCSYQDLLLSANDTSGVMLEAVHSSATLKHMAANVGRWANEPNVLTLSMEHLSYDYNSTMKCMAEFMGANETELVEQLQALDLKRTASVHSSEQLLGQGALKLHLERQPVLSELASLRGIISAIYVRQSQMYGCPNPLGTF